MRSTLMALLLLAATHGAFAQTDFKVIKLEQDVRNLERQVQELSRQVQVLQRQLTQSGDARLSPGDRQQQPPADAATRWLSIANWNRVRTGMAELEVIELLGPPTSTRTEGDARLLLYAMEIGASGFLGGSVRIEDRKVVNVQTPVLR